MTPEQFHALLTNPKTGELLNRLVADNRRIDAGEARRIREQNDAIVTKHILNWFRQTERPVEKR